MTLIGSEQVQHGPCIFEHRRAGCGHTSKKIVHLLRMPGTHLLDGSTVEDLPTREQY
ncbi:MAG: hypothetical protein WAN86_21735 [Hyphomicrobiaceae bacterium]